MLGCFKQKTNCSRSRRSKAKSKVQKRQASGSGKNLNQEKRWPYFLIIFFNVALGILQVYFSNKLATLGRKLSFYEKETVAFEEENKRLKSEIASFGGLNQVILIASEKGFVKNPEIINLTSKVSVALSP